LADVRARDLMQTSVLTLSPETPIREAVEDLHDADVQAAPVVDAGGRLVGMLSVSDVARPEHVQDSAVNAEPGARDLPDLSSDDEEHAGEIEARENYSAELLGAQTVGDWMTPRVVSVRPDSTLREVCQVLVAEGIHRVPVLEGGELRGILSTMDIVRHLAG